MARIRTFIAIDLSKSSKARLESLQDALREHGGVKWTPLENFHLTLLFLGEVANLDLVPICRAVSKCARKHAPFNFEIGCVGGFPNTRRPKILWAGVGDGADELKSLHADLEATLLGLGCYRREDRAYTPHLTLGRLTHDDDAESWGANISKYSDWRGGTTSVNEVLIMASEGRRDGPVYSVMGRAPLES